MNRHRLRVAAYLLIVVMGATGFWRVEQVQRESCERGNEFRREDLPAAFESYTYFLGDEFDAEPGRARDAYARFEPTLDALFPTRDC